MARNPGRPGRPGRPGGGPEDPGRPTGGPVVPEEREDKDVRHTRASATPPGNQLANLPQDQRIRTEGLGPNAQLNVNGQNINPQQNGFLPPQLVNPVRPDNYQLPAVQQQAQVATPQQYLRPAGMQPHHRLGDIRNNDRGWGFTAPAAATATALTIPGVLSSLAAASPAMAPLIANPATAPIVATLAGAIVASPAMFSKIDQAVNNGRMDRANENFRIAWFT